MIGHESWAGGAIHSDEDRLEVFDAGIKGLDGLSCEHRPHRFDGA